METVIKEMDTVIIIVSTVFSPRCPSLNKYEALQSQTRRHVVNTDQRTASSCALVCLTNTQTAHGDGWFEPKLNLDVVVNFNH